jgi:ferritin-like metal-binding protein YciE
MDGLRETSLHQLYAAQLTEARGHEARAAELFHDMAMIATDETVASLFRAAAAESSVQLSRVERLMRVAERPTGHGAASPDLPSDLVPNATDADLLNSARDLVQHQIEIYEAACDTSRQLGEYMALDVLLLNLDEEQSTAAALAWQISRQGGMLRAI